MPIAYSPPPPPKRQLLTYREAAEALGVCERQIYVWGKQGKIAITRLGRLARVHNDEIDRVGREGIS